MEKGGGGPDQEAEEEKRKLRLFRFGRMVKDGEQCGSSESNKGWRRW